MRFLQQYPVPLNELLLAPLVFRHSLPCLAGLPQPSGNTMRDLAGFGGYSEGAIRTAMSRLRSSGEVESFTDKDGTTRYRLAAFSRSVSLAVQQRVRRRKGFLLAIFSFASEDDRERQVVRDALRYHGFQKLAQNVYINGRIDPKPLEAIFEKQGVADNVFLVRCSDVEEPSLRRRLLALFVVAGRQKALARLLNDLRAFLEAHGLDDDEFARRFFYAGPVHYRVTYVEEPPLPASYLPANYPLEELIQLLPRLAQKRSFALRQYFERMSTKR